MYKEHQLLMVRVPLEHAYMFPGGGIEEGETFEECLIREFEEETGYVLESFEKFLIIEEHFDDLIYVNHYYIVEGKKTGKIVKTPNEILQKLEAVWVKEEEMNNVLTCSLPIMTRTLHARELIVCSKYLRWLQNSHH